MDHCMLLKNVFTHIHKGEGVPCKPLPVCKCVTASSTVNYEWFVTAFWSQNINTNQCYSVLGRDVLNTALPNTESQKQNVIW